ncbi:conserved hypothetical protein [Candida dubliniensis CD36]|uniref:Uncharacterized protein n=1 Tax=Candida dubliniensis (strain CD36 / ATCC MYA-646 / CBS 7987 / NCPF 3949 / NRRL Y-17841) TaxID=573826 RepID=B9WD75_CANDC|nr:conserved hypothetical protein [Candida dubliniensis CD36]CAX42625.1 conserved hypothetical protein [Candida dubliniensis CD36]
MEPIINQYIEFLENDVKKDTSGLAPILRSVSLFGKKVNDSNLELSKNSKTPVNSATKITIIKGYMCMLRCQYVEAENHFTQALNEIPNEYHSQLSLLKSYNQMTGTSIFKKKELELMLHNVQKLELDGSLKQQILAKIYHDLHNIEESSSSSKSRKTGKKKNGILKLNQRTDYLKSSIETYIQAIIMAPVDDLFIPSLYDHILSLLITNQINIRIIAFFYQIRYHFAIRADYEYLYIPGVLDDFNVVPSSVNGDVIYDIKQYLEKGIINGSTILKEDHADYVKYWMKEYRKEHKVTQTIKYYYDKVFMET